MRLMVLMIVFLASYVLVHCDNGKERERPSLAPGTPGAAGGGQGNLNALALTADEAERFVNSWCGSGVLTNLRKLDADAYLVSNEMPAWLNVEKEDSWNSPFAGAQREFISSLRKFPTFNAMLPAGKMILADFSSGNGCRNTQVAIDTLGAAYLKRLSDASSPNTLTCKRQSENGYHRLVINIPALGKSGDEVEERCDTTLAIALVGHSDGTLTVSKVSNPELSAPNYEEPGFLDFMLSSFILEADGSAQFLRKDGALKSLYSDFTLMYND